jgi:hypothetical protein
VTKEEECRELYRLIEGHCDRLLGVKNGSEARRAAAMLRATAERLHDRITDQFDILNPGGKGGDA